MLNKYSGNEMTPQEMEDVSRFTWNAKCTEDQIERMKLMREKGQDLCLFMVGNVKNCADRSAAIRNLRIAIMQCNLAIAHEDFPKE